MAAPNRWIARTRYKLGWMSAFSLVSLFCQATYAFQREAEADTEARLTAARTAFFEAKIRPVLVEKCYSCHSAEAQQQSGGLLLDSRNGWQEGGDSGPAIIPGNPDRSPLILAIRYTKPDFAMPPKDEGGKLPDSVIRDFEAWVRNGAPDPRTEKITNGWSETKNEEAKNWWAFQALTRPTPPNPSDPQWSKTAIDRFIGAGHDQHDLTPVSFADPATLLRRLSYDLIGLPPQPDEVTEFVAAYQSAKNPNVIVAQKVDQLLASDQFGMHWGRHWLDVARYAESTGKDVNIATPHAWRYRDYVIDAFNNDLPFDQFIREQIAGDLIDAETELQATRQKIATGFLAIGAKSINEQNAVQLAVDIADEQLDTTFQAFTGITAGCARCHDHKFDPISQKDYTALTGIFLSTKTYYGTTGGVQGRNRGSIINLPTEQNLPVAREPQSVALIQRQQQRLAELKEELRAELVERAQERRANSQTSQQGNNEILRISTQISALEATLDNFNEQGEVLPLAMGVGEKPLSVPSAGFANRFVTQNPQRRQTPFATITDSPLYARGDITLAGQTVRRGVLPLFNDSADQSLHILSSDKFSIPRGSSGRLQLADWIASSNNPLTARVITNRIWYWLMGRGLVSSLDNFGTTGDQPSNPELLDYIATELVTGGWKIKPIIRSIVLSRTYQMSSDYNDANYVTDPENKYQWRHSPRRLNAEEIRDSILNAAGTLDTSRQVGSLIGKNGDGQIGGNRQGIAEQDILFAAGNMRSVYLPVPRNLAPETLSIFDFPDASAVQGSRDATNVPAQSLFWMNSSIVADAASDLTDRLIEKYPGRKLVDFDARLDYAFQILYARKPSPDEARSARKLLMLDNSSASVAWTSVTRALMGSAEFRYLD